MTEHPWEDNLLERKVESDLKDLLKTMVAFANSVRPGHTAVILIGEKDNGSAHGVSNDDNIQRKIKSEADKIYPAIVSRSSVYVKDGQPCVRVEIDYSGETPHFGGQAWVRRGSVTAPATPETFQKLIDLRTDKVFEMSKWVDSLITISGDLGTVPPDLRPDWAVRLGNIVHRWPWNQTVTLVDVNQFWVTVKREDGSLASEPLRKLTLTFDHKEGRLMLVVDY